MQSANFKISGDKILKLKSGEETPFSAEEIYSAVIEKKYTNFLDVAAVGELENILSFSKYPAEIKISIENYNLSGKNGVFLNVSAISKEGIEKSLGSLDDWGDHIIIDKTWYPISYGSIDLIKKLFTDLSIHPEGGLSLGQYVRIKKEALDRGIEIIDGLHGLSISPEVFISADRQTETPDGLNATLYPYQKNGWQWLRFIFQEKLGGILGDEMGLGKTMQIISLIVAEPKDSVLPCLIISPTTLLENWRREIKKFAPSLNPIIHQGAKRTGNPKVLKQAEIVISSYDTVVRDASLFDQIRWKIVILDEAQAIKNPDTHRSIWIKKLNREVGIAVTGTPVENRLRDLWSIMDFAFPGYLGTQEKFSQSYESDIDGAKRLEPIVSPLLLRRKISDVGKDLPPIIHIPQWISMPEEEIQLYEKLRQDTIEAMGDAATLPLLGKLRMFCTHPEILSDNKPDLLIGSAKYRRLLEILEEIFSYKSKVIVFTSYSKMIDLLVSDIASRFGVYTNSIDGRTIVEKRQEIVDEFSQVQDGGLLALNPRAAGTGLNITAAKHVIHYNLEWNPAVEDQATARAYRRGQDTPVTVHRLMYSNTIEEGINDRLQRKRALAEDAVVGTDGSKEEMQDILYCLNLKPSEG